MRSTPLLVLSAFVATLGAALPSRPSAAAPVEITVYHSPTCECCKRWIAYLRTNGFAVTSVEQNDLSEIKAELGVIPKVQSCHTALVQGYVVEGHVPVEDIRRLLREKPKISGLAAPGMPAAAPGMDTGKAPYEVVAFDGTGNVTPWANH